MNSIEENSHLADALRYLSGGLQRMAYTANIELCHELYELSDRKWKGVDTVSYMLVEGKPVATNAFDDRVVDETALYDLGYLLRKLPPSTLNTGTKGWDIYIHSGKLIGAVGDTPENAACALAIELFKMGILGRES